MTATFCQCNRKFFQRLHIAKEAKFVTCTSSLCSWLSSMAKNNLPWKERSNIFLGTWPMISSPLCTATAYRSIFSFLWQVNSSCYTGVHILLYTWWPRMQLSTSMVSMAYTCWRYNAHKIELIRDYLLYASTWRKLNHWAFANVFSLTSYYQITNVFFHANFPLYGNCLARFSYTLIMLFLCSIFLRRGGVMHCII